MSKEYEPLKLQGETFAVHTFAVIRIKTIGDAPREGETIQDFGRRVSDAVAAKLGNVSIVGIQSIEGSDIEEVAYADEVNAVLVDVGSEDGSNKSYFFDDKMEPNDGNGGETARYSRLQKKFQDLLDVVKEAAAKIRRCDYTMARSDLLQAFNNFKTSDKAPFSRRDNDEHRVWTVEETREGDKT
jgi:Txe/YoeB family toxin of Txe-Axe toxin-antitoxin module